MAAERDTMDRYMASFLADHEGATFPGRITGVTRFGVFVRLDALGADGLVPIRLLPNARYRHDESAHALTSEGGGPAYRLGDRVDARVVESNPITGAAIFELVGNGRPAGKILLDQEGQLDMAIQVMVNDEGFLPRNEYSQRILKDGDSVKFMLLVGGG